MAAHKVICPYCRTTIPLEENFSGGKVVCPECGREWNVTTTRRERTDTSSGGGSPSGATAAAGKKTSKTAPKGTPSPSSPPSSGKTSSERPSSFPSPTNQKTPKDFFNASDESSDERIQTVTRQMGIDESSDDKGAADDSSIWRPGDLLLGGKYQVLELAPDVPYAEGGVGIVHRVHHLEWDIDFAVKSPKPAFIVTESGKQSFEQECQTWIELGLHTNIVTCYLVRRIGGIPRVFAEYVADGTLKDWIADGRLYQGERGEVLERILDIAIQFAWGLDHAHQQGLLHLDIKPGNVMMSGNTAKVTDFGLSKAIRADGGVNGMSVGSDGDGALSAAFCDGMTPSYCSPEQHDAFLKYQNEETKTVRAGLNESSKATLDGAKISNSHFIPSDQEGGEERKRGGSESAGEPDRNDLSPPPSDDNLLSPSDVNKITKQSDIWSWAISILSMFHGRSPCKKGGQTAAEVFEVFLKITPPAHRPPVPSGLIPLFRHCFQKNPADRPESMAWIADRLIEVYEEETGKPYPRTKPANTAFTAEIFCNRAISMLDLGKTLEATKLARRAAAMSYWHPQISFDNTLIEWRFGLISDLQALDRMEELTKHNGKDPYSFYALGLLQKERANPKGALAALEKGMELDPKRPEFLKAVKLCQKAAPLESRCSGRFILHSAQKGESPAVYVNSSQDFYLVPTAEQNFTFVAAASGKPLIQFKRTNVSTSSGEGPIVALSEDYRRELSRLGDLALLLKNKGGKSVDPNSEEESLLSRLGAEERLVRIPWGKKQDAFNKKGTLRLSIRGDVVDLFNVASGKRVLTLSGHKSDVTAVYMTPDGKWGATGSFDSSLKIWHIASGRCVRTFRGLAGSVDALWIDSGHRFVLTQVHGTSLQFWNIDLLCNQRHLTVAPMMICLVSSSEEISRRQSELETLVAEAKKEIGVEHYGQAVALLKKAKTIDGWQTIRSELNLPDLIGRHAAVDKIDEVVSSTMFQAHDDAISSVALAYDGKTALSAGKDQVLRLWRFPKGECLFEMDAHYDWIRSIDMTIDGRYGVSGSWDKSVRVWNLTTGKEVRRLEEPIKNLTQVRIAPDCRTIAAASGWGEITLWNGGSGKKIHGAPTQEGTIHALLFSRDGRFLLSGSEKKRITLWDARQLTPIRHFGGFQNDVLSVGLSPDMKWGVGAEAGGDILLFDLEIDGKQTPKRLSGHLGDVTSVLFLPDNRRIVSAGKDKTIRFWSIPDGRLEKTLSGNTAAINALSIDITQAFLLSGGEDAVLRLWNIYWDYDYPGRRPDKEEIARMLRVIMEHHRRMAEILVEKKSSSDFYNPAMKKGPLDPNLPRFSFDDKTVIKILAEMEFRGFGNISRSEMLQILREIIG